jgi:SAM-dependent methyltransferase
MTNGKYGHFCSIILVNLYFDLGVYMFTKTISRLAGYSGERATVQCRQAELALFERNPDAVMLDCGCRDGEFTLKKAGKIGTKKIHGIEIVESNANKAREKEIEVYRRDLQQGFPFKDETFDVVSVSQVIEHLSDTDGFLREVKRVLKKGGYAVIATPNLASWDSILLIMGGWQPGLANVSDEVPAGVLRLGNKPIPADEGPLHRRSFTARALRDLMEHHGFKIVRKRGAGFYPLPLLLDRMFASISPAHASYIVIKGERIQ